jgi:hypothetical protein
MSNQPVIRRSKRLVELENKIIEQKKQIPTILSDTLMKTCTPIDLNKFFVQKQPLYQKAVSLLAVFTMIDVAYYYALNDDKFTKPEGFEANLARFKALASDKQKLSDLVNHYSLFYDEGKVISNSLSGKVKISTEFSHIKVLYDKLSKAFAHIQFAKNYLNTPENKSIYDMFTGDLDTLTLKEKENTTQNSDETNAMNCAGGKVKKINKKPAAKKTTTPKAQPKKTAKPKNKAKYNKNKLAKGEAK